MRRSRSLLVAALLASACSKPTQIIVAVDSDLAVPAELGSVRAVISSEGGEMGAHSFSLGSGLSLPFSFGIEPGSEKSTSVTIELQGIAPGGAVVVTRRAVTRFLEKERRLLPMFLARSCVSQSCPGGQTCTESGCSAEAIDPTTLEEIDPGDEVDTFRRDAGPRDAGGGEDAGDAGPRDAGDAGERGDAGDAGEETCGFCGLNAECVAGSCACKAPFVDCDGLPGCESDPSRDPLNCNACNSPCSPGTSCIDSECRACVSSAECRPDSLTCTAPPACEDGVCREPLLPGTCAIGGACYADGETNPDDPCFGCDSGRDPTGWSPMAGNPCEDGLACTGTDFCEADGRCTGGPTPCPDDGFDCTVESCDEASGECVVTVRPNTCFADGACRNAGQLNPNNPCQVCSPNMNPTGWTAAAGAPCNDGRFCNGADFCDPQGSCVGSGNPCGTTSSPCVSAVCDEPTQTCSEAVSPGWCSINGQCVMQGQPAPGNPCMACQPGIDPYRYTPVPNDSVLCGFNALCCDGQCRPVDGTGPGGECGACFRPCQLAFCTCDPNGTASCCCGNVCSR